MKYLAAFVAASALMAGTTQAAGDNCDQQQKDLTNKLQNQDRNPAKACYNAIGGDVLQMDVRNLCQENACINYVKKLSQQLPNCTIANKNYNIIFNEKAKECNIDLTTPYVEEKTKAPKASSSGSLDGSSSRAHHSLSGSGSGTTSKGKKKKPSEVTFSSEQSGSDSNAIEPVKTKTPEPTEAQKTTTTAPPKPTETKSAAAVSAPVAVVSAIALSVASLLL